MYVTIRLRAASDATGRLGGMPPDLAAAAADLGVDVRPLHPDTLDDELGRYFYADLPDDERADVIAARLGQVASVDAAYVKPPEGPP
jgi:hypothetical protein